MSISVIITSFRRPSTYDAQVKAILSQEEVEIDEIWVWHNGDYLPPATHPRINTISSDRNLGVWPRFDIARLLPSKFVAIFDDDTIPEPGYLSHAQQSYFSRAGVYGGNGVVFQNGEREKRAYIGLRRPPRKTFEVDIVGHTWFFPKDLLYHWDELPRFDSPFAGEDYHLAAIAQRYHLPCLVPSHKERASPSVAPELGTDEHALYRQKGADELKQAAHNHYVSHGWRPLELRGVLHEWQT